MEKIDIARLIRQIDYWEEQVINHGTLEESYDTVFVFDVDFRTFNQFLVDINGNWGGERAMNTTNEYINYSGLFYPSHPLFNASELEYLRSIVHNGTQVFFLKLSCPGYTAICWNSKNKIQGGILHSAQKGYLKPSISGTKVRINDTGDGIEYVEYVDDYKHKITLEDLLKIEIG